MSFRHWLTVLVGVSGLAGCGGSKFEVAPVSGICTCNGDPIHAGLVVFEPIPDDGVDLKESGRSAAGVLEQGGTFILSTYGTEDGAIVGRHRVRVFAPAPEDDDAPLTDANRYACGSTPIEVFVEPGTNVIDVALTHQPTPQQRRFQGGR